jgi:hypothetical protein
MSSRKSRELLGDAPRSAEYYVHCFERSGPGGTDGRESARRAVLFNETQMKEIDPVLRPKSNDGVERSCGKPCWFGSRETYGIAPGGAPVANVGSAKQESGSTTTPRAGPSRSCAVEGLRNAKKIRNGAAMALFAMEEVAFPAAGITLPNAGAARGPRLDLGHSSDAQERRILWRPP